MECLWWLDSQCYLKSCGKRSGKNTSFWVMTSLRPCSCAPGDGGDCVFPYAFLCSPWSTPTLSGQHSAVFQGVYGHLVHVDSSAFVNECGFLFPRFFSVKHNLPSRDASWNLAPLHPTLSVLPLLDFPWYIERSQVSSGMLLILFLLTMGFILSSENRRCWRRTFHYRFPWMFKRRNRSDG